MDVPLPESMTSDQVNDQIKMVKALIVKDQRLAAEEILDALPVIVQLSPAVLALRDEVQQIRMNAKRKGRPPKNQEPSTKQVQKRKTARETKVKSIRAPRLPPGIHFVRVEGAGIGGGAGFRCHVVDEDQKK